SHRVWIRSHEVSPLHKCQRVRLFIGFQLRLPIADVYLHTLSDPLCITKEVRQNYWHRRTGKIAERRLVDPVNQISSLLKLDGHKECRRDVDPLHVDTLRICPTRIDFIGPEVESRRVWFSIEEINVVLPDKKPGAVNRIHASLRTAIINSQRCSRRS